MFFRSCFMAAKRQTKVTTFLGYVFRSKKTVDHRSDREDETLLRGIREIRSDHMMEEKKIKKGVTRYEKDSRPKVIRGYRTGSSKDLVSESTY